MKREPERLVEVLKETLLPKDLTEGNSKRIGLTKKEWQATLRVKWTTIVMIALQI